jgi:two-component system sensor histidine kinase CpxA
MVAIEACTGKNEGDPCTFSNAQDVIRSGECLTGVENVFACRPHRGAPSAETVKQAPPVEQVKPPAVPQSNVRTPLKSGDQTDRQVPQSSEQKAQQPVIPARSEPPVSQIQPAPSPKQEPPAAVPQSVPSGIYDVLGQYAGHLGSYLAVALIAAGLAWYGFFRYSTVPLRRLRMVTQQLAGGDLSARVGEGLVLRKNEVADLGRDVDRMAERIESLVGAHQRLIRDVSHELRSPLARLNVALELARQSAGPAHSAPFDRIERESDRLNELIGQLLMLTKLENESGSVQRSEFDIATLAAEIAQDADFEAKSNDRRVQVTACQPLLLNGNRELLRQALENLVRNAVRYTATGTSVEISLRKKDSGGRSWAHIEVRDQGPGVPESELYDIFRPFYRVSDSRERQSGGTGVGLAISDRAVRMHGGSLRAFNAPGMGLIMEMELPLGQD